MLSSMKSLILKIYFAFWHYRRNFLYICTVALQTCHIGLDVKDICNSPCPIAPTIVWYVFIQYFMSAPYFIIRLQDMVQCWAYLWGLTFPLLFHWSYFLKTSIFLQVYLMVFYSTFPDSWGFLDIQCLKQLGRTSTEINVISYTTLFSPFHSLIPHSSGNWLLYIPGASFNFNQAYWPIIHDKSWKSLLDS